MTKDYAQRREVTKDDIFTPLMLGEAGVQGIGYRTSTAPEIREMQESRRSKISELRSRSLRRMFGDAYEWD